MAKPWRPRIIVHDGIAGKPQVLLVAAETGLDRYSVVGRLVTFWLAAQDKADGEGRLKGKSLAWVDLLVMHQGFAAAIVNVGWLAVEPDGLRVPGFEEFFSKRSVKREEDAARAASNRSAEAAGRADSNCDLPLHTATHRDEVPVEPKVPKKKAAKAARPVQPCPLFDRFWAAYPRKVSKPDARVAWAKLQATEELLVRMVAAIGRQSTSDQWVKDNGEFIPYPASWLNSRRWEDEGVAGGRPVSGDPRIKSGTGGFTTRRSYSSDAPPAAGEKPDSERGRQGTLFS